MDIWSTSSPPWLPHHASAQWPGYSPGSPNSHAAWRGAKKAFPSMWPLLASPLAYVSSRPSLGAVSPRPEWARGFLRGWPLAQRPANRAGVNTRPPSLDASCDNRRQACGRRSHRDDGVLRRPGMPTGHLHHHVGAGVTQHRQTASASLRTAPAGKTPVARKRHSAMSTWRLRISLRVRASPVHPA